MSEYRYVPSCELQKPVILRISSLLGSFDRCSRRPLLPDMCVRVKVYCNQRLVGPEVQTEYRPPCPPSLRGERHRWGEVLELPIRYSELSEDAFLLITLWAADRNHGEIFVAQCVEKMFSKHGALHSSQREIRLIATPSGNPEHLYRPSEAPRTTLISAEPRSPNSPNIPKLTTFTPETTPARTSRSSKAIPTIEELTKQEKKYKDNLLDTSFLDQLTFMKLATLREEYRKEDNHLYLVIEYPPAYNGKEATPYFIVYYFSEEDGANQSTAASRSSLGGLHHSIVSYHDRDLGQENLHENKHLMITRNARALEVDRLLVPNPRTKTELEDIIKAPSCAELTVEKRDVIWKFRYFLQDNANALTKFIRSVNWEAIEEKEQAQKIIEGWTPISIYDVLELLGPDFSSIVFVRRYAVSRLRDSKSSDDEVLLYLPQLVQALRYEHSRDSTNELADYLVDVAADSFPVANYLFWYLKVEIEATHQVDDSAQRIFIAAYEKLKGALSRGTSRKYQTLRSQEKFVQTLNEISKSVDEASGNIEKKTDVLRKALTESTDLQNLDLLLPVDPSIKVKSIIPAKAHIFKSSQMPMSLTFQTANSSTPNDQYTVIFKRGDDLRQDQLIMQMIHIMDNILKAERLNLYLTPYAILATSLNEGFVQYIRATPVADLDKFFPGKKKEEHIQLALQKYRPSAGGPCGIESEVMDRFLRSSAGYCVLSYILGIGDRHLHNVLLCEDGRIFHIDFGYVLGRDPKPLPPPMKISPSMVFAMGGMGSQHYKIFVDYCRTAFTVLQQHAKLITNLFGLMLDAGIPDIAIEKDKAVAKVLERFHLNIEGDSHAIAQLLDNLIETSIKAIMPLISDFVHGLAT